MGHSRRGRPPAAGLTDSQRRTLREIRDFITRRQFPPTMQELADELGVTPATVHQHVNELARKGYVLRERRKARGLAILREPEDVIDELVSVPLLGNVTAGNPILAEENAIGEVLIEAKIANRGRCFALHVMGDSMVHANIRDGDIVVVRQQSVAESGDIVVALLHDEATVKRLHIRGDRIELRPENNRYRPRVIGPDSKFRILGKVIGVRQKPRD